MYKVKLNEKVVLQRDIVTRYFLHGNRNYIHHNRHVSTFNEYMNSRKYSNSM